MVAIYLHIRWASICTSKSASSHPPHCPPCTVFKTLSRRCHFQDSKIPLTLTFRYAENRRRDDERASGTAESTDHSVPNTYYSISILFSLVLFPSRHLSARTQTCANASFMILYAQCQMIGNGCNSCLRKYHKYSATSNIDMLSLA